MDLSPIMMSMVNMANMTTRRRRGVQATMLRGRRPPGSSPAAAPRNVVSAAGQSVLGMRRNLLRYVDFHPALFLLTGTAIVALVCVIYLGQVTAVTNANYTLQKLQGDHSALMRERENLQLQIAQSQSLANIEKMAREKLHMVPIGDNYQYLTVAPGPLQDMGSETTGQGGGQPPAAPGENP